MKYFNRPLVRSVLCAGTILAALPAHAQEGEKAWYAELWDILTSSSSDEPIEDVPQMLESDGEETDLQIMDWPVIGFVDTERSVPESAGVLEFEVRKNLLSDRNVAVSYVIETSPELEGRIIDLQDGRLEFAGGDDRKTIRIRVIDDDLFSGNFNATLRLTDVIGGELGNDRLALTVIEDEAEPKPPAKPGNLVASQNVVDFGAPLTGLTVERQVLIKNNGKSSVYVSRIDETADNVEIVATDCDSVSLFPETTCSVTVAYVAGNKAVSGAIVATGETKSGENSQVLSLEVALKGSFSEPPQPKKDPLENLRRQVLAERSRYQPATISTVEVPVPEGPKKYRMSEADITDKNSPGRRVFDYPVDLSRIITTSQELPCVTTKTVNTQLVGTISCKIESPILGTHAVRSGRAFVLLEPDTIAEGIYEVLTSEGETRTNVKWTRFTRPDGSSLFLANGFPGQDAMGRMGLHGPVDNHDFEKFVTPLAVSTIVALGTELLNAGVGDISDASQQILVDGTTRVVGDIAKRNLDLRPIMTIPVRSRLLIKPTVDLYFKETEVVPLDDPNGVIVQTAGNEGGGAPQSTGGSGPPGPQASLAASPTTH